MLYSSFSLQNIYISTLVVSQKGNLSKFCSLFLLYLAFSVSFWSGMRSHICVTPGDKTVRGQIFLFFPAGWFSPYFLPFPAINHKFSAAVFLPDATVYSWLYEKRSEPWRKEDVTESPGTQSIFVLYICCGPCVTKRQLPYWIQPDW
jgi:hypothetical protein